MWIESYNILPSREQQQMNAGRWLQWSKNNYTSDLKVTIMAEGWLHWCPDEYWQRKTSQ